MSAIAVTLDTTTPNTVRLEYNGRWTWVDFHESYSEILRLGKSFGGQPWQVISLQYNFTLPPGDAISHAAQEFQRLMDAKVQHVVCVTDNALFTVLARLGLSMHNKYRHFLHVVRTEDEAYAIIRRAQARNTLPATPNTR